MSLQAWETAMGMGGYAGSPAQREALAGKQVGDRVMIQEWRGGSYRFLRLHSDADGLYVRVGKRGTIKRRVTGHHRVPGPDVVFECFEPAPATLL